MKARSKYRLCAFNWATVAELHDVTAAMTADTILQILRGDAHYYGPGSEIRRTNGLGEAFRGWRESPRNRRVRVTGWAEEW